MKKIFSDIYIEIEMNNISAICFVFDFFLMCFFLQSKRFSFRIESIVHNSSGSRISPRRGANSPEGAPTYDFAKFFQKLHEIERIWAPPGGTSLAPSP